MRTGSALRIMGREFWTRPLRARSSSQPLCLCGLWGPLPHLYMLSAPDNRCTPFSEHESMVQWVSKALISVQDCTATDERYP